LQPLLLDLELKTQGLQRKKITATADSDRPAGYTSRFTIGVRCICRLEHKKNNFATKFYYSAPHGLHLPLVLSFIYLYLKIDQKKFWMS
jgi:hypothetical protein